MLLLQAESQQLLKPRSTAQVIHAVAILKATLEFAADAPAPYQALAQRCMAADPAERPSFVEVTRALQKRLAALPVDPELASLGALLARC